MRRKSNRIVRVNELLKHEIGIILERYIEYKRDCLVSIVEVDTSTDLRHAQVFVSIYGSEDLKKEILQTLKDKAAFFQSIIAKNIKLKYTPVLYFVLDKRFEEADRVLSLINELENKNDN